MNTSLILFTFAYFFINSFFAGWLSYGRARWYTIIMALLFGVLFLIYTVLMTILVDVIWKAINEYFQLGFFWQYHFGHGFRGWKPHDIKKLNDYARKAKASRRPDHYIYRYCISLINERNNYKYVC